MTALRSDRSLDASLTDEQRHRMIRYHLACQFLSPPDAQALKIADRLIFLRWLVLTGRYQHKPPSTTSSSA